MKRPKLNKESDIWKLRGEGLYLFPYPRKVKITGLNWCDTFLHDRSVEVALGELDSLYFADERRALDFFRRNVCSSALDLYWRIVHSIGLDPDVEYTGRAVNVKEKGDEDWSLVYRPGAIEQARLTYLKLMRRHDSRRREILGRTASAHLCNKDHAVLKKLGFVHLPGCGYDVYMKLVGDVRVYVVHDSGKWGSYIGTEYSVDLVEGHVDVPEYVHSLGLSCRSLEETLETGVYRRLLMTMRYAGEFTDALRVLLHVGGEKEAGCDD